MFENSLILAMVRTKALTPEMYTSASSATECSAFCQVEELPQASWQEPSPYRIPTPAMRPFTWKMYISIVSGRGGNCFWVSSTLQKHSNY